MKTYKIIRFFTDDDKVAELVQDRVTLEQAKDHCNDPSTNKVGVYFDGYIEN